MGTELGPLGEFRTSNEPKVRAIKFRNLDSGQEMMPVVIDKFPQMGEVHIEGRRVIEVSIEMFTALIAMLGFEPVDPATDKTPHEAQKEDE